VRSAIPMGPNGLLRFLFDAALTSARMWWLRRTRRRDMKILEWCEYERDAAGRAGDEERWVMWQCRVEHWKERLGVD
jgi:hypothetical protein